MSTPFKVILPLDSFVSPAIASPISTCPFPETPAMANTSPACILKETSLTKMINYKLLNYKILKND